MTDLQVGLIHAGIRSAQVCAFIAAVLALVEWGWWGVLVLPVIGVMVAAWQVLYENIP